MAELVNLDRDEAQLHPRTSRSCQSKERKDPVHPHEGQRRGPPDNSTLATRFRYTRTVRDYFESDAPLSLSSTHSEESTQNNPGHRMSKKIATPTGIAILRAILAGDRDPLRLAVPRDGRRKKAPEQFAVHLTGTWRAEHLFNLERSPLLYDKDHQEIAAYERRLEEELAELVYEESAWGQAG